MTAAPRVRDPARYRWIVLAAATFTQAASGFYVQGLGALGVQLEHDLHIDAARLGLLFSAAQFAPLAGLLVAGELLDRFDERWVVGAGATVVGGALLAGTLAPGYPALLAVMLAVGAGYSTVQPGGSKSVASWFDDSRRGTAMGIRQAGLPLGAVLASAALPPVAAAHGWRATLAVGGGVALAGAVVFMLVHRPPVGRTASAPAAGRRGDVLRVPELRRALLTGTSLVAVHSGIGLLTVLHLHEVASLSPGRAAAVVVVVQLAGAAGRVLLAAWSDRARSRQHVVRICLLAALAAIALLVTPAGRSPVAACAAFVWLGFFGIGWYGPWVAQVTEAAPPGRTGFALGTVMTVNQIAVVVVPPVLGLLRDTTGGFTAPWCLLVAATGIALAGTARPPRQGHRPGPPDAAGRGRTGITRGAATGRGRGGAAGLPTPSGCPRTGGGGGRNAVT